jgi:hypothetical protein
MPCNKSAWSGWQADRCLAPLASCFMQVSHLACSVNVYCELGRTWDEALMTCFKISAMCLEDIRKTMKHVTADISPILAEHVTTCTHPSVLLSFPIKTY